MKFLTAIALLAATAIAGPVARAPEQEFHLKTAGAKHKHHNNLFVYAYHTGAGLNDAVLDKDASIASPIYLNGTKAQANLQTEFPWGLVAVPNTNYASWEPIEINAGQASNGFSIQDGNFVWSEQDGFGGWLVCNWFHNAPQLFYLNRYYKAVIPCSCSKVNLRPVYIGK